MSELREFIRKLPKAELHLHIEGSLEPELMMKLSKKNNVRIPFQSVEEIRDAYNFSNLQSFLDIYYQGAAVLIEEEDFFDLTWEYLVRAKEDGIIHSEIFFDPQTHTDRGISFETVISGISRALEKGNKELGITSHIIMCFLRHLSEDEAMKTLEDSLPFKHLIKGVGLDSSEFGHPPSKFERVFKKAMEHGFLTVAHAGEEGPAEYIWEAIKLLNVKRIDHGVRCLEDSDLVEYLIKNKIPLTVCPFSNIKLCVFDKLENHNLKTMLEKGLHVLVNSDDPAYFGGYLLDNLVECANELNLSRDDLKKLCENSITASFLTK